MERASDEALVAGVAAGDADAALVFVRRWQRRVFGLALTIVRDTGRAEDVAQEAFVRAWRHAGAFDARRGSVATWLMAITRNLAIDAVRVERARPAEPADAIGIGVEVDMSRSVPGPDDRAGVADDVRRVVAALEGLPEDQRRALLLAALHGRTAREIAGMEDIPLGTAKTRVRTALIRVRARMGAGVDR